MHRNRISVWLLAGLLLTGCGSMKTHWPFSKARAPAPEPVSELEMKNTAGESALVLQFWERNTLVLDLQGVPATGQVVMQRRVDHAWPARIAIRMAPQSFEVVEVRGAQRVVLPVAGGSGVVTVELAPGIHAPPAAELTIRWGARGAF